MASFMVRFMLWLCWSHGYVYDSVLWLYWFHGYGYYYGCAGLMVMVMLWFCWSHGYGYVIVAIVNCHLVHLAGALVGLMVRVASVKAT